MHLLVHSVVQEDLNYVYDQDVKEMERATIVIIYSWTVSRLKIYTIAY